MEIAALYMLECQINITKPHLSLHALIGTDSNSATVTVSLNQQQLEQNIEPESDSEMAIAAAAELEPDDIVPLWESSWNRYCYLLYP
jgi:hypothetical protein